MKTLLIAGRENPMLSVKKKPEPRLNKSSVKIPLFSCPPFERSLL